MTRTYSKITFTLAVALGLLLAGAAAGLPLQEDGDDERIVRKVRIHCEGDDCEEHTIHHRGGNGKFAWFSGDGPAHFRFRTHLSGGYLGVQLAELTPELRAHFGVDESAGVMISKVMDDSPAARAGLAVGDIITGLDDSTIGSSRDLSHAVRAKKDGESVLLEVWRDGSVRKITAAVEERKPDPSGMEYAFVLECDDDKEDCAFARRHVEHMRDHDGELACEGGGPCRVKVECQDDDDCVCTINDEPTDCESLPGFGE